MGKLEFNTFSITARCKKTGMLGVAVSTARPSVGSLVPHVKPGIGAIATQARVNPYFGIDGIKYLEQGLTAEEVLEKLKAEDKEYHLRQVAIVDAQGNATAFTGDETVPWAGHIIGDQFAVAGNMLVGEDTIKAMAETYEANEGMYLPERLLAALIAGQQAGGDKRGKQSAALYVVDREEYAICDIRVDEHPDPTKELERIYRVCETDLFPYLQTAPKRYE